MMSVTVKVYVDSILVLPEDYLVMPLKDLTAAIRETEATMQQMRQAHRSRFVESDPPPCEEEKESMDLREKYIGAVSLLCRVYAVTGAARRADFEMDGDPMAQLADDFNRLSFPVCMERASGGWGLFKRKEEV